MNTDMALSDPRILSNRRKFEVAGRVVWVFKTRAPAVRKFNELCQVRIAENEHVRAEHRRDLAAAKKGDLSAALRLGDY
jgi:Tfp pilus assembly protein PilZ